MIDAIFGIGLNSDIRGSAVQAISLMNESPAPVVAADISSGVETDSGRILGSAVEAAVTVTFTLPKAGHFVGKGGICTGRLVIHDIGIPRQLVDGVQSNVTAIDQELVRSFLPKRPADGHKGTFGKVYVMAGSVGYTGAPVLSSRAAVRTGSGLVFLGVPKSIYPIVAMKSDEAMPSPLPEDEDGRLSDESLVPILEKMAGCDAALIGPGLGRSKELTQSVCSILSTVEYPIVLDADGLNAVSEHIDTLYRRRECPTIITPHDGEFARLGGDLSDGDRLSAARKFAMIYGCLLVLKGHCTIIALPDGEVFLNTTGNSGMAKGGSGDVLSGMILSLIGQGIHPVKAAVAAVWLHGRAGDLAAQEKGEYGMTPTDLLEQIPYTLKEVTEES
jgi:NAD(P)H-hydrate epimerase